jgi:hypothetical protein
MSQVDKAELLGLIRRAKSSHIRWRAYAQSLVEGVSVDEDKAPVRHTDCRFGQWYFGEGARLLRDLAVFKRIQAPHENLHSIYEEIHGLVARGDFEKANSKLQELVNVSRTLLDQIDRLEEEVSARY